MYLSELQKTADILCVQEHWLCEFQKHTLSTTVSEMDVAIRCSDSVEDIQNFNLPRGKGGVAIAWKKQYSHLIDELPDGNERILAIEMKHPINLCIISAYMPTNNSSDSYIVYLECFDVIKDIIAKYSASHSILLSCDMNGTIKEPRKYNKHDALLQSFIEEINLKITPSVMPTFYHHSGDSTSQIDYILHNSYDGFLLNYTVNNKCDINISSHVPVSASLSINWNGKQIVKKSNQTCIKQPIFRML